MDQDKSAAQPAIRCTDPRPPAEKFDLQAPYCLEAQEMNQALVNLVAPRATGGWVFCTYQPPAN